MKTAMSGAYIFYEAIRMKWRETVFLPTGRKLLSGVGWGVFERVIHR
jgi:hypothetical protein